MTYTYSDCIKMLNPFHLKKIAEHNGIVLIPFSSNAARNALIEKMGKPGFIEDSLDKLNPAQSNVLMVISLFSQYLPVENIHDICVKLLDSEDNLTEITASLLSMGLIYCVENLKDDKAYYLIPYEFKDLFDARAREQVKSLVICYEGDIAQSHLAVNSVELSILSFLIIALKKEIKLNMGNKINKRTLNKIESLLNLSFDSISENTIGEYVHDIFVYAKNIGFIKTEEELDLSLIEQWVKLAGSDRKQFLYSGFVFRKKYKSPLAQLANLLSMLPSGKFFDISSLYFLCGLVSDVDIGPLESFLKMPLDCYPVLLFYHLGMIELASNDSHCYCAWKITETGAKLINGEIAGHEKYQHSDSIIIQPNFDLLISRTAEFELLWTIYRIADLAQCGQLLRFQITKESIYRGLSAGVDKNSIIPLLENHSKEPVSQNVMYSLKEWCEDYGAVYFMDIFLLRCKTKNIADQLKMHPKTKDYIKGNFSDTDLFVCKGDYQVLMEELKAQGFMPLEDIIVPEEEEPVKPEISFFSAISGKSMFDAVKPLCFELDKIKFIPEPAMVQ